MPVVPWDGEPVFGGKTLVLSGKACRALADQLAKRRAADWSAAGSVREVDTMGVPDPDLGP
jgi:hypothetical protein